MVFSSHIFLYWFLPLALGAYFLTPWRLKSVVLTAASYVFYGWWRPDFVVLMLFSTVVDFLIAKRIARAQDQGRRGGRWLALSVTTQLALLGWFKYANFGVGILNDALARFGHAPVGWEAVVLPVGISFYTFQTMSYTIDIYRRHARPVARFIDFMCFVSLFPQLVAGPIVRYTHIKDQLVRREHSLGALYQGIAFFAAGFAKKLLIADVLGGLANDAFGGDPINGPDAWLGIVAYTFQIYFDFSGYSDMAIGLGMMMGFTFPANFNQPYRSVSITDFWRRWHMTLSSWLRDYLYIPLGGNRHGGVRTYVNLAITMLLGGLWHGANWTFIVWGAWQGFWLILERISGRRALVTGGPRALQIGVTFVVIMIGWVFFRSATLPDAVHYLHQMFLANDWSIRGMTLELRPIHLAALTVAAGITWGFPTTQALAAKMSPAWVLVLQPAFLLAVLQLHFSDNVPFLYFQF